MRAIDAWRISSIITFPAVVEVPVRSALPLPPDTAERRRARHGEPYRSNDYSGTRWRYKDLPALGWRHRRHYDMRATFITLAIEDGANPDVIETRVTHSRKARNVFDGYNCGLHWERTCAEISKLRITRGPHSTAIDRPLPAGGGPEPLLSLQSLQAAETLEKSGHARGCSPEGNATSLTSRTCVHIAGFY